MAAQRMSMFAILAPIFASAVLLVDASVSQAQSIAWNAASPTALGGGRFNASGTYTIPANGGGVTSVLRGTGAGRMCAI